jgi:hypothetical protein
MGNIAGEIRHCGCYHDDISIQICTKKGKSRSTQATLWLPFQERHSAIQICTEESDYSDIPRTEYDSGFSIYRGAKEELQEDAPELLGKHGLPDTDGWYRFHSLAAKRAKKMLHMVNQSKLWAYKTCKKYMYGFEIPLGYEDAIRLHKLHGNNKWQSATKLEMDHLHGYDTFHDKGIQTTPGEEFKKI